MLLPTSLPRPAAAARGARRASAAGLLAAALAAALAGCGGATIEESAAPSGSGSTGSAAPCGQVDLAISPWVGYEANAAVVAEIAETRLGCEVVEKDLKEEIAWQGFGTGEVDAIVENWGHEDLKERYVSELGGDGSAVLAGETGGIGTIGWYVPGWMAEEYPDITDWKNLNKYAELFRTSESGDKGQLLDGDPSFVTNDEALVENLDLDYEVVYAGSEAALISAFRTAQEERQPLLGYFYDPQWLQAQVELVKVDLPPYEEGCDAVPEEVACDYPQYVLDKAISKELDESGSPFAQLVRNFSWDNEQQNVVAGYIADDGMEPREAAQKWIAENEETVAEWLEGTGAA